MDDNRTMGQLLEAPTEGYEDAIVVPEITANNFEIKHGLLNLVQNKQFFGHDKEDLHAHIRYFNKITSTMKFLNVPSTSVKLMLFLFSSREHPDVGLTKNPLDRILHGDESVNQPPAYQAPVYQAPAPQTQGVSKTDFDSYVKANDAVMRNVQNQGQNLQAQLNNLATSNQRLESMLSNFIKMNTASTSGSGTLPGNTITNPKEDLKEITTRSGVAYQGPAIPSTSSSSPKVMNRDTEVTKDTMLPTNNGSTEDVQPPVVQVQSQNPTSKPVVDPVSAPMPNQRTSIPFPSRRNDERRREKANDQIEKFYEIFRDLSFEISFTDADPYAKICLDSKNFNKKQREVE
ncbi:hypothetical protein Tco_0526082 [Tanacetum coccineum]